MMFLFCFVDNVFHSIQGYATTLPSITTESTTGNMESERKSTLIIPGVLQKRNGGFFSTLRAKSVLFFHH